MSLKYHQATYDLLTHAYIDPKYGIQAGEWERDSNYQHLIHTGESEEVAKQESEALGNKVSAWTSLDLYNHPVTFSIANLQKLAALEVKYNVKIPDSVREWFSLDICPEIMSACDEAYLPIFEQIEDFKPVTELNLSYRDDARADLFQFLHAEYDQSVKRILFQTGAGDDPPVFAMVSDGYEMIEPTFSEFIYRHFWLWHALYVFRHNLYTTDYFTPRKYWRPKEHFASLFKVADTGKGRWFYDEHVRIIGRPAPDDELIIAGGQFRADSMPALKDLILKIWGDDAPVFHFRVWEPEYKAMLLPLQLDQMRRTLRDHADWMSERQLAFALGNSFPNLSLEMETCMTYLLENDDVEAHPDNTGDYQSENRYRLKI